MILEVNPQDMPETQQGSPVWEMALQYPRQGDWTLCDYLTCDIEAKLVEFDHGCLQFLTLYGLTQARIQRRIADAIDPLCERFELGELCYASLPLILSKDLVRMPDLYVIKLEDLDEAKQYPRFARMVVKIVNDGPHDRELDHIIKKRDYETHKIPEYWVVDRFERSVTVHLLDGETYQTLGTFRDHESICSRLFKSLSLTPNQVFHPSEDH